MADKKPMFPEGTTVHYPDGSVYVYLQSAQKLEQGQYVEPNVNKKMVKFKGGLHFPRGICMERVDRDEYTLVMTQEPQVQPQAEPKIAVPGV